MGTETGGNVIFVVAPPLGATVTLVRTIQISIDTNFSLAQNFNGANLDAAFERVTLFTQQVATTLANNALQYVVNTYLPNDNSNDVPVLGNGQVWSGLNGAIVATTIENNANTSLLRSQLLSELPLASGSLLVGYYDTIKQAGVLLGKYLDYKDVYGYDTGVADALVLTIPNSNFDYANGQSIRIVVSQTNLTTTPAININGKGAILIKRSPLTSAQPGDLTAGSVVYLTFDSSSNSFSITNLFIPTIASITPTVQTFNFGSGTYNKPSGAIWLRVRGVGGGAQGGGVLANSSITAVGAGGGGGSGAYFEIIIRTPLSSYSYAVGAAGAGAGSGQNNGVNGGTTTFGTSFLIAPGGFGGIAANGGLNMGANISPGGQGANIATGGHINLPGVAGGVGCGAYLSYSQGGQGGASKLGGSVAGPYFSSNGNASNGNSGFNYGSGGSGAARYGNAGNAAGGAGSSGFIIVEEYYS